MESNNEIDTVVPKDGFVKTVFNFDRDSKSEILNTLQYALLSVVPLIILNKLIHRIIPEADEDKGTLEISIEALGQIVLMFTGLIFVHRIIAYIPTYSEVGYDKLSLINATLMFMMLMLSLQTKLGEKINILLDRLLDLWDGNTSLNNNKQNGGGGGGGGGGNGGGGGGQVRVTQPGIAPNTNQPLNLMNLPRPPMHAPSQSDTVDSRIMPTGAPGNLPTDFNNMYQSSGNNSQQAGAHPPANPFGDEGPMAANGMLGGSFGSAF
jgi:hypothetical protein